MWRRNRSRTPIKVAKGDWIPLGDELEAFVHGDLARAWGARGPLPPWLHVNQLAHRSLADLRAQAAADPGADDAWDQVRIRLIREIVHHVCDDDELREIQKRCLWSLEDDLITAADCFVPDPDEFYRLVHSALQPLVDVGYPSEDDERPR